MTPFVENNLEAIRTLCKKYEVQSLYLFGSAARNDFSDQSDIDFLLNYKKNKDGLGVEGFDYFDLLYSLEDLIGKKIDLVVEDSIKNYIFRQNIESDKLKIYEA